jgi:hypothetical protein
MAFGIYKLLKREVHYPGADVLVPESWQLQLGHVSDQANNAELAELVRANPNSSYIMVKIEASQPEALPKLLSLEEGLRLTLATEDFLQNHS